MTSWSSAPGPTLSPFRCPGRDLDGVIADRDLEDTGAMIGMVPANRGVAIGGGLMGLEAAADLTARGEDVTGVHVTDHIMEHQLDALACYLLCKPLEAKGSTILCGANSREILCTDGRMRALVLEDDSELPCDLLVMAVTVSAATWPLRRQGASRRDVASTWTTSWSLGSRTCWQWPNVRDTGARSSGWCHRFTITRRSRRGPCDDKGRRVLRYLHGPR